MQTYTRKHTHTHTYVHTFKHTHTHTHTRTQHYGFTKLFANSTTLTFKFIHHEDGEVHDSFVLQKTGEGSGAYGEHTLSPFEL